MTKISSCHFYIVDPDDDTRGKDNNFEKVSAFAVESKKNVKASVLQFYYFSFCIFSPSFPKFTDSRCQLKLE